LRLEWSLHSALMELDASTSDPKSRWDMDLFEFELHFSL
jgi:hypothetical protein